MIEPIWPTIFSEKFGSYKLIAYLRSMISQQICEEMLQEHGVKPTANRIVVVKALADAERPLSLSELEYKILSIDKSGVFRALTLFR